MAEKEERSTATFVGVDVCKRWLDVSLAGGTPERIPRSSEAWRRWLAQHQGAPLHIIVEATGGLEMTVAEQCEEAAVAYSVVNPLRVRLFAKSIGKLAKTDAVDAAALAKFGEATRPRCTRALSPERQRVRALVDRRRDLVEQRTAERNRLTQAIQEMQHDILEHVHWLDDAIRGLDRRIARALHESKELREPAERLRTVKGVGVVTAATMVALVPELGSLDRRQIAALVGLAPFANESGARQAHRRIYGGRAAVRSVLYMSALVAARFNPQFRTLHRRLIAAGKPHKVALTAVSRKLLTVLNAMQREHAAWRPPSCEPAPTS